MVETGMDGAPERSAGARITDEAVMKLLERTGVVRAAHRPWNTAASADSIGHFALGIGNLNPLWLDADYAAASRFGGLIAPPTFEYSCGVTFGGGMPGVHSLYGGSDFTFIYPIRAGGLRVDHHPARRPDRKEQQGTRGRMFQQIERMVYTNQDGVVVTDARHWVMRTERDAARERAVIAGRHPKRRLQTYTGEGIAGIDEEYDREVMRGSTPRYWDDSEVGDFLPPRHQRAAASHRHARLSHGNRITLRPGPCGQRAFSP